MQTILNIEKAFNRHGFTIAILSYIASLVVISIYWYVNRANTDFSLALTSMLTVVAVGIIIGILYFLEIVFSELIYV